MKEERLWSGRGKVIFVDAVREARKRLHTRQGEAWSQLKWLFGRLGVGAIASGDQQSLAFECCEGKTSFGRESVFYF